MSLSDKKWTALQNRNVCYIPKATLALLCPLFQEVNLSQTKWTALLHRNVCYIPKATLALLSSLPGSELKWQEMDSYTKSKCLLYPQSYPSSAILSSWKWTWVTRNEQLYKIEMSAISPKATLALLCPLPGSELKWQEMNSSTTSKCLLYPQTHTSSAMLSSWKWA